MKELSNTEIIPLFIPQSQSQKYHLQNVQLYEDRRLVNLRFPCEQKTQEVEEMEAVMEELLPSVDYSPNLRYPIEEAQHITTLIQKLVKNIKNDEEVFLDNIVINTIRNPQGEEVVGKIYDNENSDIDKFYELYEEDLLDFTPEEIIDGRYNKKKLYELFMGRCVIVKIDVYMALPYSEEILTLDEHSSHKLFLEKFQSEWEVERPWRYVSVRNWIIVPKIGLLGEEIYDFSGVAGYARTLRRQIYKIQNQPKDLYKSLRKVYAYLLFVQKYYGEIPIASSHDQIQFYMTQKYDLSMIEDIIKVLNEVFNKSSMAFVYGLLSDLKTLHKVQQLNDRIDTSFVKQTLETIKYLLDEHHIKLDEDSLCEYINRKTKEVIETKLPIHPLKLLY